MVDINLLLDGLLSRGYCVERGSGAILVRPPGIQSSFALLHESHWIQLASILISGDVLVVSENRGAVERLALDLHGRYLGCRLGYDEVGDFTLMVDLFPTQQTLEGVEEALGHLACVAPVLHRLLHRALEEGHAPSDSEVDEAFEAV